MNGIRNHLIFPALILGGIGFVAVVSQKFAFSLAGQTGPFAVLVEEQPLPPSAASIKPIAGVVDHRDTCAFSCRQDRQDCGIASLRLVVEQYRIELSDALLRDRQEARLGADQDVGIAVLCQQRVSVAFPTLRVV